MDNSTLLFLLTFLPLAGVAAVLVLPRDAFASIRCTSLAVAALQVVIVVALWAGFNPQAAGADNAGSFQFLVHVPWLEMQTTTFGTIRIDFLLGLDGLSLPMVMLASVLMLVATIASWRVGVNVKGFFVLLLLVNTGVIGSLAALDLFLFYLFTELVMLPLAFLAARWGSAGNEGAGLRLLTFSAVGSALLLIVIAGLCYSSNVTPRGPAVTHTFNMLSLMNPAGYVQGALLSPQVPGSFAITTVRAVAFVLVCIAFAVKLGVPPFHTWLPRAMAAAPTPVALLLAGIVIKLGGYGLLRIGFSLFPDVAMQAEALSVMAILGGVTVVYGGLCALARRDLDRGIGDITVAGSGLVLLGIGSASAAGISAALTQMLAQGLIMAMLVLLAGLLRDRVGDVRLANFGGLMRVMPRYSGFALMGLLAALGLPGLAGWWGQSLTVLASFHNAVTRPWAVAAAAGLVLAAAYAVRVLYRIFMGTLRTRAWEPHLHDLTGREAAMMSVLALLVLALGVWPAPVLNVIAGSVDGLVKFLETHGSAAASALNIRS